MATNSTNHAAVLSAKLIDKNGATQEPPSHNSFVDDPAGFFLLAEIYALSTNQSASFSEVDGFDTNPGWTVAIGNETFTWNVTTHAGHATRDGLGLSFTGEELTAMRSILDNELWSSLKGKIETSSLTPWLKIAELVDESGDSNHTNIGHNTVQTAAEFVVLTTLLNLSHSSRNSFTILAPVNADSGTTPYALETTLGDKFIWNNAVHAGHTTRAESNLTISKEEISDLLLTIASPADLFDFSADDVSSLRPEFISELSTDQISTLPAAAMKGFNADRISVLSRDAVTAFSPQQIKQLSAEAISGFSTKQLAALSTKAIKGLTANQVEKISQIAFKSLDANQLRKLSKDAVTGLTKGQLKTLSGDELSAFKPKTLRSISPKAIAGLKPTALNELSKRQIKAFTEEQLGSLSKKQLKKANDFVDELSDLQREALLLDPGHSNRLEDPLTNQDNLSLLPGLEPLA